MSLWCAHFFMVFIGCTPLFRIKEEFFRKAILYSGGDLAKDGEEAQEGFSTQFVCVKEIEAVGDKVDGCIWAE